MAQADDLQLVVVGRVVSSLVDLQSAPRQGSEGAPDAAIEFDESFRHAMSSLKPGDQVLIFTWLHLGDRQVLTTHPRNDTSVPKLGVFSTRSPDRPNPIGLHPVRIQSVSGLRVEVSGLEALDGTPVLDVKPVL